MSNNKQESDQKAYEFESDMSKKLDNLYRKLKKIEEALDDTKKAVQYLQAEEKREIFKHIPGIEGSFDGLQLVTSDGKKYDVPANYAAKSKLVYGDVLKLIEVDGKEIFKQVEKKERKELHAVLSKKEGQWFALTDAGSYQMSETVAEYNQFEVNDEAVVLVPEDNLNVPFAALDEMVTEKKKPETLVVKKESPKKPAPKPPVKKSAPKKPAPKAKAAAPAPVKTPPAENVNTIRNIEEDDLV